MTTESAAVPAAAAESATGPAGPALARYVLALGDDALVRCQRLCSWITRAPTIEEDLALSNIALDLLGHARALLDHAGRLDGTGRDAEHLAYRRTAREFRNVLLVELPDRDFAAAVVRQLAHSQYTVLLYRALAGSTDPELAAIAARAAAESAYHRTHAAAWTVRLGRGTAESRARTAAALEELWPYTGELFEEDEEVAGLAAAGLAVAPSALREEWRRETGAVLAEAGLPVPRPRWTATGGRSGLHTEVLEPLVAELQSVHRQYPGGTW
ncbi:1,2-phenylacetyl-CoA epoxidase subunit PaaC [Kitasatospora sp. NPDC056327]|uniref:1,2-phenylacetyl-CoA epoxidase subunit PaaC n=1 Tax=Kitasatospora sp. NPDC056327 TaxID=3345785 RepID=UPI0035E3A830